MPFHAGSEIPLKCALRIGLDPKAERVHYADQLLGVGIARTRRRPERFPSLGKLTRFHEITRLFDVSLRWGSGKEQRQDGRIKSSGRLHAVCISLILAFSTIAAEASERLRAEDFRVVDPARAKIGQLLFYDKILSGNHNIACATCHHHDHASGDGLSLGIGEGGQGIGPERTPGKGSDRILKRIPRNSPALWNLGHKSVAVLFHDGRLSVSPRYGNGFDSPAEEWLPRGFDGILAAQAVFPLVAPFEMAGHPRENEVAGAVNDRIDAAWPIIAKRVRTIPAYGQMFVDAFDEVATPEDVTIVEIGNALGAFMASEWQSYDSAYDAWLEAGTPLPDDAERGRELFFGKARCADCHSGPLFTDHDFHALGLPAFGPGRTRRFDPYARDVGRMAETDRLEDAYRFRTPSLRNVSLTAPYGHNGAWPTLEGIIRQHLDPEKARASWTPKTARLPSVPWLTPIDFVIQEDDREMARQAAKTDIQPVTLSDREIDDLVAFLHALTGKTVQNRPFGRPETVPSGLPVD
jgi:cytochrome c peroxidase